MFIAPFLLVIMLLFSLISPVVSAYSWFVSLFHHQNTDSSEYTIYNEKETDNYKAEQDYNNAIKGSSDGSIKGIIKEYQEKYGVTIDWYLLNALITYRYTGDEGDLYSSSGNEEIDEEEIENKLKELEKEEESSEELGEQENTTDDFQINYSEAQKKINAFATLMVVRSGSSYTTDKEKDGLVYNNVLSSKTFTDYYKDMFADDTEESRKKLLDTIYDYAEGARELLEENNATLGGVISSLSTVQLQTCRLPYSYQTINNIEVYNNPLWNEGTNYPDTLDIKDYLKGVVSREIGISSEYKEAMKAQMIAALTFLINDSKSGFDLKNGAMYFPSGTCRQATCSPTNGCTSVIETTASSSAITTFYVGKNRFSNSYSYDPLTVEENTILDEVIDSVFGKIMVKKGVTSASFSGSSDAIFTEYRDTCDGGSCFSQKNAQTDAKNGMTYEEILAKYYSSYDYDIIDITEGLYFTTIGTYNGTINLNEEFHYHQGDEPWRNQHLCGVTAEDKSFRSNGCNITAAAIAISLLTNQKITPETLNNRQNDITTCKSGSRPQMIIDFAKLYGLTATEVKKSNSGAVNDMLSKLATGKYVSVVRLTAGVRSFYKSKGGHYMTLVGVRTENGTNEVLVWDPAGGGPTRDNRWVNINELMTILRDEYSFILIGRQ